MMIETTRFLEQTNLQDIIRDLNNFPEYIFAVGGAGKRIVLGMFGYDYETGKIINEFHFKWLVSSLRNANRNVVIYIIDSETRSREKDSEICRQLNDKVNEVSSRLGISRGSIVFIYRNLEPSSRFFDAIGGRHSIEQIKTFLQNNGYGRFYWINTGDNSYGDVDPQTFDIVLRRFNLSNMELSTGVQRIRALTKAFWYYYLKFVEQNIQLLPNVQGTKIAIFGGLGGGTGSTLILELSKYYSRRNNTIYIFGILPAVENDSETSKVCGYITLTELESLMIKDIDFRNNTYVFLIPLNFLSGGIISQQGEIRDELARKVFPLCILYLVLGVYKHSSGGESPFIPGSRRTVAPFILAPTYLIEIVTSSNIEEDFRSLYEKIKDSLRGMVNFIQQFGERDRSLIEPEVETYIELARYFGSELDFMEGIIEKHSSFGIIPNLNNLINNVINNYINTIRGSISSLEQVVRNVGSSDRNVIITELRNRSLGYGPVLVNPHTTILNILGSEPLDRYGGIDRDLLEILLRWISYLKEVVNSARRIEDFVKSITRNPDIIGRFWASLFLSANIDEDLLNCLQREADSLREQIENLDRVINRLNTEVRQNIRDIIRGSKDLEELIEKIKEFKEDRKILTNDNIIENFRRFLERYVENLNHIGRRSFERYVNNPAEGAEIVEIQTIGADFADAVNKFEDLLKRVEKYSKIIDEGYYTQLIEAFSYRCYSVMSRGLIFKNREYETRSSNIKEQIIRKLSSNTLRLFGVNDKDQLYVALTVGRTSLRDKLRGLVEEKQKEFEEKLKSTLTSKLKDINDKLGDILKSFNISINIELKLDIELRLEDVNEIEDLEDVFIGQLDKIIIDVLKRRDELFKVYEHITRFYNFCVDRKRKREEILSALNTLQTDLGRSGEELCNQYDRPKLKYTLNIRERGELHSLLEREDVCQRITEYLIRQLNCFLTNHRVYLGFESCPLKYQNVDLSFDKVNVILGVPTRNTLTRINRERLGNVISDRLYPSGGNIINFGDNIDVNDYSITIGNVISLSLLFVGVWLENISTVRNYYECFERELNALKEDAKGTDKAINAIYIRYVNELEQGMFYMRRLIQGRDVGKVYVKNDVSEIEKDILKYYNEIYYIKPEIDKNKDTT